ncbi:hypothetical protein ACXYMO_06080 [Arenibacterium sp. CAU 1754]
MKVILHIGAHRCATTTFQHYMRQNSVELGQQGVGFWGPHRTRGGLLRGLIPPVLNAGRRDPRRRAIGRVRLNLARCADRGVQTLVISDENMMGSMRDNLISGMLYPSVGERMARYHEALEGQLSDVIVNVRSPDRYWASVLGFWLSRRGQVPCAGQISRLGNGTRTWRDVLTDVGCAVPGARVSVLPFETFGGRPDAQLQAVTGPPVPRVHARAWLNQTPRLPDLRTLADPAMRARLPMGGDRWQPFDLAQKATLRENYADDIMWLAAGADGLAHLMKDPDKIRTGPNPSATDLTRGRPNDDEKSRMARTR